MISKKSTTGSSLFVGGAFGGTGLSGPVWAESGDFDVDLVDARTGRRHGGVTIADRGQRAQRP
jgi:hypothetical protein